MNKHTIAFLVIALALTGCTRGCNKNNAGDAAPNTEAVSQPQAPQTAEAVKEPKVEITDSTVGKGAEAVNGKSVTVHYTGKLKDGTKFDSSLDRKEPFTFSLGSGQVIKGWEQGIQGMKVGGKRKLVIPPELAYGSNAVGAIPANSVLVFDVELLEVK